MGTSDQGCFFTSHGGQFFVNVTGWAGEIIILWIMAFRRMVGQDDPADSGGSILHVTAFAHKHTVIIFQGFQKKLPVFPRRVGADVLVLIESNDAIKTHNQVNVNLYIRGHGLTSCLFVCPAILLSVFAWFFSEWDDTHWVRFHTWG